MANRIELQTKLEELLGSRNVYYKPPETLKLKYPAIEYSKANIEDTYANNSVYSRKTKYTLVVIDTKPDNPVINKLLDLPYCSYSTNYKADNLEHDVLTLYF